jgi:hypothetical protein
MNQHSFTVWIDTDKPPDEIMERAADIIDEKGWHRGSLRNGDTGAVCLLGALRLAADPNDEMDSYSTYGPRLMKIIKFIQDDLGEAIADWNDGICKDKWMAIEMLQDKAKHYRSNHYRKEMSR